MKIKSNLKLRQIGDEYIMITDAGHHLDYTQAIALNETSAYLIRSVENQEFTAQIWATLLTDRYEVDKETALADCEAIIATLRKAGVIEE